MASFYGSSRTTKEMQAVWDSVYMANVKRRLAGRASHQMPATRPGRRRAAPGDRARNAVLNAEHDACLNALKAAATREWKAERDGDGGNSGGGGSGDGGDGPPLAKAAKADERCKRAPEAAASASALAVAEESQLMTARGDAAPRETAVIGGGGGGALRRMLTARQHEGWNPLSIASWKGREKVVEDIVYAFKTLSQREVQSGALPGYTLPRLAEAEERQEMNGEFIYRYILCANPANDLTCPPSYIII